MCEDRDSCFNNGPCGNYGTCITQNDGNARCQCNPMFTGPTCQQMGKKQHHKTIIT